MTLQAVAAAAAAVAVDVEAVSFVPCGAVPLECGCTASRTRHSCAQHRQSPHEAQYNKCIWCLPCRRLTAHHQVLSQSDAVCIATSECESHAAHVNVWQCVSRHVVKPETCC